MGKKTYGKIPGVTVTTSGGSVSDPIGELKNTPGIRLWGHSIILEGDTGIKCKACEKEEEIPELLSMSSGFREVVYKMYVLGKFREESCSPDPDEIDEMLNKRDTTNWPDRATHRVHPNKIYWSKTKTTNGHNAGSGDTVDMYIPQGDRVMLDGETYTYWGDGTWLDEGDGAGYSTVDLFERHGSTAEREFPKEIVHEKKGALKRRQDMMDKQSLDTVGIGDLQDTAGPLSLQDNNVGIVNGGSSITNQSVDVNEDKSTVQKFAEKVQKGHFLTR